LSSEYAMYMIKAILAISDGWNEKPGSLIQREDPPALSPMPGMSTATSMMRHPIRMGTAYFFHTW